MKKVTVAALISSGLVMSSLAIGAQVPLSGTLDLYVENASSTALTLGQITSENMAVPSVFKAGGKIIAKAQGMLQTKGYGDASTTFRFRGANGSKICTVKLVYDSHKSKFDSFIHSNVHDQYYCNTTFSSRTSKGRVEVVIGNIGHDHDDDDEGGGASHHSSSGGGGHDQGGGR